MAPLHLLASSTATDGAQAVFTDRADAARFIAAGVDDVGATDATVVGLPGGGVLVAAEVARLLSAPLDLVAVSRLVLPLRPGRSIGAIGENDVLVTDALAVRAASVTTTELDRLEAESRRRLERRALQLRQGRPASRLTGRTVVVVDEAVTTGARARAACLVARARDAARVVLAVPVAPAQSARWFEGFADDLVIGATPRPFLAAGRSYADLPEVTDRDCAAALTGAAARPPAVSR